MRHARITDSALVEGQYMVNSHMVKEVCANIYTRIR